MLIVSKWWPNPKSYLLTLMDNSGISFRVNDDWNYVDAIPMNLINAWHFVVAIKKQNDLYVYVDGSLINQDYISWPTNYDTGYSFKGFI
jgi:hypothetical protein